MAAILAHRLDRRANSDNAGPIVAQLRTADNMIARSCRQKK